MNCCGVTLNEKQVEVFETKKDELIECVCFKCGKIYVKLKKDNNSEHMMICRNCNKN